jgi:O-antigen/teichoic acid export membrane protein
VPTATHDPAPTNETTHRRAPRRLSGVVGSLTATNFLILFFGLITGPLQARALGPAGRGTLAAIQVPIGLAPMILGLGLGAFAAREAALGKRVGEIMASVGAVTLAISACFLLAAEPLARFLADGRSTVHTFLLIGFLLIPLGLLANLLGAISSGLERWNVVIAARLIPPLVGLLATVVLYAAGSLTVASAAIVTLGGGLAAIIPVLRTLRGGGRLRIRRETVRRAVPFGVKAWFGVVASLINVRLDQLLMIRLVSARDLGLYAVATTVGMFSGALTSALSSLLLVRTASEGAAVTQRSVRVCLAIVIVLSALVALVLPVALPLAFGDSFSGARTMSWILLAAGVPLAGVALLSAALTGANRPALPAYAEFVTLAITIPGLILLLPRTGAIGAAWVSLGAYAAAFVFLLRAARRTFGGSARSYLLVRREDVEWARERLSPIARHWRKA